MSNADNQTKHVFALWGAKADGLHGAPLRDALRVAGATRMQLNVDDEHVAEAKLRLIVDGPIDALVCVWGADAREAASALSAYADRVEGWRVTERTPIPAPQAADGVRLEALANNALLRRPADMTREAYLDVWLNSHTDIAIRTQGTFGYIQNIVEEAVTPHAPALSAIVEELFPMEAMTDDHAWYGSGGDPAELERRFIELMESVMRFGAGDNLDTVPTSRYCWSL